MEVVAEMEEREPATMRRLALEEAARYWKELAYFRAKQRLQTRRTKEEEEKIRRAKEEEEKI